MLLLAPPGLFWYKETRLSCRVFVLAQGGAAAATELLKNRLASFVSSATAFRATMAPLFTQLVSLSVCHSVIAVSGGKGKKKFPCIQFVKSCPSRCLALCIVYHTCVVKFHLCLQGKKGSHFCTARISQKTQSSKLDDRSRQDRSDQLSVPGPILLSFIHSTSNTTRWSTSPIHTQFRFFCRTVNAPQLISF